MALKFRWGFEGNSNTLAAEDYSAGDSIASDTNITYGAAGAKVGSYGMISAASVSANALFNISSGAGLLADSSSIDGSVGSVGYWWKVETTFPTNGLVNGFRMYAAGSVSYGFRVQSVTGSKLQLVASNPLSQYAYAAPAASLSEDIWYFVIVRWDVPNNKMKIELYTDGGSSTLTAVTDGSAENTTDVAGVINSTDFGVSTWTGVQFGVKAASTAVRTFTDNIVMSDVYAAPLENNAFITNDSEYSESTVVTYLKLLAPATAASAADIEGVVLNAARDTVIGEFTAQTFEAALEGSEAVLKIPIADISPDGSTLTTLDTPLVIAYNTTYSTDLAAATVIEE